MIAVLIVVMTTCCARCCEATQVVLEDAGTRRWCWRL